MRAENFNTTLVLPRLFEKGDKTSYMTKCLKLKRGLEFLNNNGCITKFKRLYPIPTKVPMSKEELIRVDIDQIIGSMNNNQLHRACWQLTNTITTLIHGYNITRLVKADPVMHPYLLRCIKAYMKWEEHGM